MNSTEQRIIQLIEEHKEEIIQIGRSIWQHPELGYKEFRTSRLFCDFVKKFGLESEQNLAITGAKAYLKDKKEGDITVSLIGEMDALPMADSPHANPETGAAHCCGHNAQMAGMMGALFALADPQVREAMDGNVVFFAVPSEEYVEMEFQHGLMQEGKIRYGGGKFQKQAANDQLYQRRGDHDDQQNYPAGSDRIFDENAAGDHEVESAADKTADNWHRIADRIFCRLERQPVIGCRRNTLHREKYGKRRQRNSQNPFYYTGKQRGKIF